ncbi:MAG: ABC transporter ATP-binding protein [Actinocatenispora sp.]
MSDGHPVPDGPGRDGSEHDVPGNDTAGRDASGTVLELTGLSRAFGSLTAVDAVSLRVRAGARHALIGPNGAGKSTLFNLVAGTLRATAGRIVFRGRDVTAMPEHRRARLGLSRTFQHASVFSSGTALDNVLTALHGRTGQGWSMGRAALRRRARVERSMRALDQVGLADAGQRIAGELSHGGRRQLELAMALVADPVLLLLDEPAAGISPGDTERLATILTGLPADVTVLLIEHDLDLVFDVADTVTVLHLGRQLRTGDPAEIRAAEDVRTAYLGAASVEELFPSTDAAT